MGKIVVSTNITLDGVVQDPTGEEGFPAGGWFSRLTEGDREAWTRIELDEARRAAALLMGRRSYEWFATRWAARPGEWADRLRILPKYVVTKGVEDLGWMHTTMLTGDAVDNVSTLRKEIDGDIVVYASAQLAQTLMTHDLVDELRLMVHPFVLGSGTRLFGETGKTSESSETSGTSDLRAMHLVGVRTVGEGLAFLTYQSGAAR